MTSSTSDRGRILIVDDDRRILDLLLDLLQIEGYEVATAADGAEAIDLALSFDPDIVVSDVVMPHVSGLELCRRLKEDPHTAHVPVLLISGLGAQTRRVSKVFTQAPTTISICRSETKRCW